MNTKHRTLRIILAGICALLPPMVHGMQKKPPRVINHGASLVNAVGAPSLSGVMRVLTNPHSQIEHGVLNNTLCFAIKNLIEDSKCNPKDWQTKLAIVSQLITSGADPFAKGPECGKYASELLDRELVLRELERRIRMEHTDQFWEDDIAKALLQQSSAETILQHTKITSQDKHCLLGQAVVNLLHASFPGKEIPAQLGLIQNFLASGADPYTRISYRRSADREIAGRYCVMRELQMASQKKKAQHLDPVIGLLRTLQQSCSKKLADGYQTDFENHQRNLADLEASLLPKQPPADVHPEAEETLIL